MPKPKTQPSPDASADVDALDPKAAEKSLTELTPRLLAIPAERLAAASTDIQRAAAVAAAVGRFVTSPAVLARFQRLPREEFDLANVHDLQRAALVAWYTSVKLQSATANRSEAKVPMTLVQRATEVKQRMLRLVEYHFGDDPVDGPEIADIKIGSGYPDLASDLVRLSDLYKKHHDRVKLDPKHYVPGDEKNARMHALEILRELGEARNQDQKTWADLSLRAWTLLLEVYGEVSDAGRWLFRKEGGADRFPSLYTVGRAPRTSKARETEPAEAPAEG